MTEIVFKCCQYDWGHFVSSTIISRQHYGTVTTKVKLIFSQNKHRIFYFIWSSSKIFSYWFNNLKTISLHISFDWRIVNSLNRNHSIWCKLFRLLEIIIICITYICFLKAERQMHTDNTFYLVIQATKHFKRCTHEKTTLSIWWSRSSALLTWDSWNVCGPGSLK